MTNTKKLIFALFAVGFLAGAVSILAIPRVIAHEGNDDPDLIHGCVNNLTDILRVVDVNTDCGLGETPVHFPATLTQLPPFACGGCNLSEATVFQNKDLSNAWLKASNLSDANFEGAIFTDANFQDVTASGANFRDADMSGVNFSYADLTDAVGMTTTVLTGAVWSSTTCPDGTNSNSNGNTCAGHLAP